MKTVRINIAGERWKVKFARSVKLLENGQWVECDGMCDPNKKEIRLHDQLRGKELTRVLLHEIHHATCYILDEEIVDQTSIDQSEALYHPEIRGRS